MYYDFIMSNTRHLRLPVFLILAILLSACSDDDDSGAAGTVAKTGQTLYDANCASCHGADGTGGTSIAVIDATAAMITDAISTVPDMNTINLTVAEIQDIADYLAGPINSGVTNSMGGAIQGIPLDLTAVVTTLTDSAGVVANFNSPRGITTDGTNLYVADFGDHTVSQIVIATGAITTLAGSGTPGSVDATGTAAQFDGPNGITTDGTNLYVTDYNNQTIRQIVIATGEVTTLAGSAEDVADSVDAIGVDARFNGPRGITTDGTNLYVADTWNATIRQIVIASGSVTTLAGTAIVRDSVDGIGADAHFNSPYDITTDGTNLYVADFGNQTVRQIVIASGAVTTLAGTVGVSGSVDATGLAAQFNNLGGITSDGTNLYVADTSNNTVRQIVIATGDVTTLVGSPLGGGSADGTGAGAKFSGPLGITTDGVSLYVTDTQNNTVRQID